MRRCLNSMKAKDIGTLYIIFVVIVAGLISIYINDVKLVHCAGEVGGDIIQNLYDLSDKWSSTVTLEMFKEYGEGWRALKDLESKGMHISERELFESKRGKLLEVVDVLRHSRGVEAFIDNAAQDGNLVDSIRGAIKFIDNCEVRDIGRVDALNKHSLEVLRNAYSDCINQGIRGRGENLVITIDPTVDLKNLIKDMGK